MLESSYYILLLIALAGLIAYLQFLIEKRERVADAKWLERAREEEWKGQVQWGEMSGEAFHVGSIAPQIERLRQDHLAARHSRPHDSFYRRGLLAVARQAITSLSFFRRAKPEHEMQKRDA